MGKNSLWFPRLSSWMSAILLLLLTGLLSSSAERIVDLGNALLNWSPRLFFLATMLAILSPIIFIAYLHHLIQLILDRLDPDHADHKLQGFAAFWPVAMSWWEGLYGWLVILLSTLLAMGLLGMMMPWNDERAVLEALAKISEMLMDVNKIKYLFTPATLIWILVAAYLYQFEHVVMLRSRQ